jgi:tRNA1Val (adenine37-N6)-methyltransferase
MTKSRWDSPTETLDTLYTGRLKILQKKAGYRFSIDALLLASFVEFRDTDRMIDLGTGCGILPLILAFRREAKRITGVEVQPSLADLARRNAALNRLSGRIQIWERDFTQLPGRTWAGKFDRVISNPPYREVGSGRINPQEEKALARHEFRATLQDVLKTAYLLLKEKGRLAMIYPASRAIDLLQGMRQSHLEPKRLQWIHSRRTEEARLLLVEALKGGRAQSRVLPPFFLYDEQGQYTPEANRLFI